MDLLILSQSHGQIDSHTNSFLCESLAPRHYPSEELFAMLLIRWDYFGSQTIYCGSPIRASLGPFLARENHKFCYINDFCTCV